MHTLSLQDTAPYDRTLEESVLFTGFLAWEKQTSGFLTTLGQSAETFRKAAPHLGPDLASNLTVFKNNAAVGHLHHRPVMDISGRRRRLD